MIPSGNSIHVLQSDSLYVEINEIGAGLHRLYSKKTKTEYLWEQQASVFFPIVGQLKGDKYSYNGKSYHMPYNGFAANMPFVVSNPLNYQNALAFTLEDTPATRTIYPFSFALQVVFIVNWSQLEIAYQVINETNGPMYFSCGSYEGYTCPRLEGETLEDYYIEFNDEHDYESFTTAPGGLLTKSTYPVIENGKMLPLNHKLFENDSLVFIDIPSGNAVLGSRKSQAKIDIAYDPAPNLMVWTKKEDPFIGIGPSWGVSDFEDNDEDLTTKPGIILLEKGGVFIWKRFINIYE
ncbi:MAG: hypothetical protein FWC91_13685 [Defluviitaleaceae bacterium]|nr:hypothetical protein [Defluviitaleaceae bacterium]